MSNTFHIGSITTGYRPIKSGAEYDRYFPKPESQDRIIIEDGEVHQTVDLMKRVVWKYIDDTKQIAPILSSNSKRETCRNIWNFLYHHIQYRLDKQGLEELRRPARSWSDRKSGIDCDCFSIFCSSILTNLKIPHSFRITKYGSEHYQHVYVVVPDQSNLILIDAVLSSFDYEKPFTKKKDFTMNLSGIDVAVLSGHNEPLTQVLFGTDIPADLMSVSQQEQLQAMYNYLVATRNSIAQNPSMIASVEDPEGFIKMLDYALTYWNTDKRDEAIAILIANEIQIKQNSGLFGENTDYSPQGMSGLFEKVGNFLSNVGSGIVDAGKAVVDAVVQYNPISVVARLGFLAAMRLNLKRMGTKLKWAYASQSEAAARGISSNEWTRAKTALSRIENLYVDKLQGDRQALKDAILKGRAGGLGYTDTYENLGEPISMSAAIAAATPVIIATLKILQETGLIAPGEDINTNNLVAEAEAAEQGISTNYSTPTPSYTPPSPSFSPSVTTATLLPSASYPEMVTVTPNTSSGNMVSVIPSLPSPVTNTESGGIMSFIKKNPGIAIAGAGALAFGAYLVFKPKKRGMNGLAGPKKRTYKRKATSSKRKTKSSNYTAIKKLTLK
jgi:hypothetical protein